MNPGDVKRDPVSGDVAVRTTNDEAARPNRVWLVATTTRGARFATTAEVEAWDDIYPTGS